MNPQQKADFDEIVEALREENPEALLLDGFEGALIGRSSRCGQPALAVYDYDKLYDICDKQGMEPDAIEEHLAFNVLGAWVGPHTPIVLMRTKPEDW